MKQVLVINGPNLQLLGTRKPDVYGATSLTELEQHIASVATSVQVGIDFFQSNCEGAIVDRIAAAKQDGVNGIVINPAAYTHTSIAIHDALESVAIPAIEVHISNVHTREEFRHNSMTAPACVGQIVGLGTDGYEWALRALVRYLEQ
jgi:3-dehydroquinate dehydratase II